MGSLLSVTAIALFVSRGQPQLGPTVELNVWIRLRQPFLQYPLRRAKRTKVCRARAEAEEVPNRGSERLFWVEFLLANLGVEAEEVTELVNCDSVKVCTAANAIARIEVEFEVGVEPDSPRRKARFRRGGGWVVGRRGSREESRVTHAG